MLGFCLSWLRINFQGGYRISISLSHQGSARKPKLIEQGVTIFTKLNNLNAEKSQPSGDLNPKQRAV